MTKIIQLLTNATYGSMAMYSARLYRGMKENGYEVTYARLVDDNFDSEKDKDIINENMEYVKLNIFDDNTVDFINTFDCAFFHELPLKKESEAYINRWLSFITDLVTCKKAWFNNIHKWRGLTPKYPKICLSNADFWNNLDHIVTFAQNDEIMCKAKALIGEDEANKKFIMLQHPHYMDMSKKRWKSFEDINRVISYYGRACGIKDPGRLIEMHDYMWNNGFDIEMHGIYRTFSVLGFKDMVYKWVDGKPTKENSPYTQWIPLNKSNVWLDENERPKNKILMFGAYELEDGLKSMASNMFGVDFFMLPKIEHYGNGLEYVMFDIIESGGILVMDSTAAEGIHLYDNAEDTGVSVKDSGIALYCNHDLSDIDDMITKMKEISSDKNKFEEMRNKAFDAIVKHTNPKAITKKLVENVLA